MMFKNFFSKKVLIVTHDGTFHADDVFAVATITLWLDRKNQIYHIKRSRDQQIINLADYIFDVGTCYDPQRGYFDHHQQGGAGKHESGIPYAAFGLAWRHFGLDLCHGDEGIWKMIEARLVEPIDAIDNGVSLVKEYVYPDRFPYTIGDIFSLYRPNWDEVFSPDIGFFKSLPLAREMITRYIDGAESFERAQTIILDELQTQYDQDIVTLKTPFHFSLINQILLKNNITKPQYIVYPTNNHTWRILATKISSDSFEVKKPFPEAWRGVTGDMLVKEIGVDDVMFCHDSGFLAGTKTQQGALTLAQKALIA